MTKLKKIASISDTFLKVCFWLDIILCAVVSLEVILLLGLSASAPYLLASNSFTLDFLKFILPVTDTPHFPQDYMLMLLLQFWCVCGFSIYIIKQLRFILQNMKEGKPFHCQVSTTIRRIAFAELIGGIALSICSNIFGFLFYQGYHMDTLFLNNNIQACKFTISFDFKFLFVFVLLLLLSYVFQYGEELQTLSDETL